MTSDAENVLSAARSDPRYVRQLFDQFSLDYDSRMRDNSVIAHRQYCWSWRSFLASTARSLSGFSISAVERD